MADSAGRSVCRTCKKRPRAEGKMRCQTCLDLAAGNVDTGWPRPPAADVITASTVVPGPAGGEYLRGPADLVQDGYDVGAMHTRIAQLEQQVVDLEAELAEERARPRTANEALSDILPSMLDRAKNKGDVQAAKFIMEHAHREREEALAGRGKTIDDFIVPAGTNLDPDPKEQP